MKLKFMKEKVFLFIFISLSLFFYVKNSSVVTGNFSITEEENGIGIGIEKNFISKYVLVTINGDDISNNEQYILSVYSDIDNSKRVQLGQSKDGVIKLFLSKDDFKENIETYIECKSNQCSGIYKFENIDTIELLDGEPINYYISKENTTLEFSINGNYEYLNVWIRGQYNYDVNFQQKNITIQKSEGNYGNYYLLEDVQENITFSVTAEKKGDYINIGYIGYNKSLDYIINSNIKVNGPILTGFLKKDIVEEVCFNLNDYKGNVPVITNGFILTKYARIFVKDENKENILNNPLEIDSFKVINDSPDKTVCVSFPDINFDDYKELIFTIEFLQFVNSDSPYSFYEPQLNGIPYLRTVPGNSQSIISFQNNGDFRKLTYNTMAIDGNLKMYIKKCDNYPNCTYEAFSQFDESEMIHLINRFGSYNINKDDGYNESPICQKQYMLVVTCEGEEGKFYDFKSLMYKDNEKITLSEDKFFNQIAPQNQENNYKINIPSKSGIKEIDIDITSYIGEIGVNTSYIEEQQFSVLEKNEINKKIIQVKINQESKDELLFSVKALTNTYYVILVTIIREDNSKTLEPGMTYLLTIDPKAEKNIIKYTNDHKDLKSPFMIDFYSLNCEIEVKDSSTNEESSLLKKYENFYYQIINHNDGKYESQTYDYQINIISEDISGENLCKIYTSAIEGSEKHDDNSKDVLVQDNTPQQVIFNKNSKSYSFGYVHVDYTNDLLVKFDLKHSAKYKISLFSVHHEKVKEETIVGDDILYFKSSNWEKACETEEICYLHLDITLEMAREQDSDYILEITAKSINSNSVTYLQKNYMKKDFIQNKISQNYYTELGKNEEGFVFVNFLRGSGKALAKIVSKEEKEDEPNWKGKYRLPTEEDTLEINSLTNRITFNASITSEKCKNGCFLLITIVSDIKDDSQDIRNYPYTLLIHSHLKDKTVFESPSVITPLNTYVIGSLGTKNYSEFYSFWLNSDADQVLFDMQTSIGGLAIYLGEDKINFDINNTNLTNEPMGSDYLLSLSKEDILKEFNEKHNEKRTSIKDLVLNIAIWSDLIESIYEAHFSFSVALQIKGLEIIRVNSDHKTLCNPKLLHDNVYRCLYVIEYDFLNEKNDDLFIFANIKDKSALFNIYANRITSDSYELAISNLEQYVPTEDNHDYPRQNQNTDYLYIEEWKNKNDYILVSVEVTTQDQYTSVELITHIPLFQNEIIPNLANSQLLTVEKGKTVYFKTSEKYMPMIGIMCIGGSGEIYWDSQQRNKYYLKGRDDRLQITTKSKNDVLKIEGKGQAEEKYGMIFILYYNLKPFETNLAALELDGSVRYIYNGINFPISYCSSIKELIQDNNQYYDFFFTFDKLYSEDNKESKYFDYDPFEIYAFIVNQTNIAEMKKNNETEPYDKAHSILGDYDQTMRTGIVRIEKDLITEDFGKIENPYLYLKIGVDKQINPISYSEINVETTILKSNSTIPISESSNQFGFLGLEEKKRTFILKNDRSKKYLILEFSSENDYLLASFPGNNNVQGKEFIYGKIFYTIETKNEDDLIDFEISRNEKVSYNDKAYFMFRYTFNDDRNYKKYNLKDTKLKVKREKINDKKFDYTIELTAIDNWRSYSLSYIVRIIEEEMPYRSYVSLKPVEQKSNEYENPLADLSNDKLIFKIPNVEVNNKEYVQVIIQIKSDDIIEYISYDLQNSWEEDQPIPGTDTDSPPTENNDDKNNDDDDDDDDDTALIVVVSCIGGVIIILVAVLSLFVFTYGKKTKNLLDQVNNVSFKADKDKDSLLLSDDKNALE